MFLILSNPHPGVHQKALETYDIIFKCMGTNRLAAELFIYSAGTQYSIHAGFPSKYNTFFIWIIGQSFLRKITQLRNHWTLIFEIIYVIYSDIFFYILIFKTIIDKSS